MIKDLGPVSEAGAESGTELGKDIGAERLITESKDGLDTTWIVGTSSNNSSYDNLAIMKTP